MASTLKKATSFNGFAPFSYAVMETKGYKDQVHLDQDTTFGDRCKAVEIIDGKYFNKDNQIFYTSLRVYTTNCRIGYCDKHENNKNGRAYWR